MTDDTQTQGSQKGTDANSNKGNESQDRTLVDEANDAAQKLKAENDRRESLLKREQELEARRILGGQTSGNVPAPQKTETDHEYRLRMEQMIREGKKDFH